MDFPLFLSGKKLRFEFDEELGIKAYNLSSFEGHHATKEVFLYSKNDKKILYFLETDWISDWVTIKYNGKIEEVII